MSLSKLLHIFRDIYDIFWRKSRFGFRNFRDLFILWNNFDFWKYYSFVNCSWCVFYASSKCQFLHHGGSVEVVRYKHFPWNGKPIQRRDYIKWAYFSMPISLFFTCKWRLWSTLYRVFKYRMAFLFPLVCKGSAFHILIIRTRHEANQK